MELTQEYFEVIGNLIKADKRFEGHEDLFGAMLNEAAKRVALVCQSVNTEAELAPYLKKIASTSVLLVIKTQMQIKSVEEAPDTTSQELLPLEETPQEEIVEKLPEMLSEPDDNINLSEPESIEIIEAPENVAGLEAKAEAEAPIQNPPQWQIDMKLPHERDAEFETLEEKLTNPEQLNIKTPENIEKNIETINSSSPYKNVAINFDDIKISPKTDEFAVSKEFLQKIYETLVSVDNTHASEDYLKIYELRYVQKKTQSQIAQLLNLTEQEVSDKLFRLIDAIKSNIN